jgi:site-specific recombinase XerD
VNDRNNTRNAVEVVVLALQKHQCSESTVSNYRKTLNDFLCYLERSKGTCPPQEKDCVDFIESMTGVKLEYLYATSPSNKVGRVRRPLVLLLEVLCTGKADMNKGYGRYAAQKCPLRFDALLQEYLKHCVERGNAEATISPKRIYATSFFCYLDALDIKDVQSITTCDISGFLLRFPHYRRKTMTSLVSVLRDLFGFFHATTKTVEDLAAKLPKQRSIRNETTPYLWSCEEIVSVLAAIDRTSAIGKRDYAMILLVTRLGLRTCDLRLLEPSCLNWQKKTLTVLQRKTARPLRLPLLDDVGWAIIDYLKNGRPETDCPKIFVKHSYPFNEFGSAGPLTSRLYKYAKKAGIAFPKSTLHGMHSLRSALARTMLRDGTPLPVISEVLGHADSNTTAAYYLRFNTESLRSCAQDVEDIIGSKDTKGGVEVCSEQP